MNKEYGECNIDIIVYGHIIHSSTPLAHILVSSTRTVFRLCQTNTKGLLGLMTFMKGTISPHQVQRTTTAVNVTAGDRSSQNRQVTHPVCKVDDDLFLSFVVFVKLHTHTNTHADAWCVLFVWGPSFRIFVVYFWPGRNTVIFIFFLAPSIDKSLA